MLKRVIVWSAALFVLAFARFVELNGDDAGATRLALAYPVPANCKPADQTFADPDFEGADEERRTSFECRGQKVDVFLFRYLTQSETREATSESNEIFTTGTRGIVSFGDREVGDRLSAMVWSLEHRSRRQAVARWYAVGTRHAGTRISAKWLEVQSAFKGARPPIAAFVVVVTTDESLEPLELLDETVRSVTAWYETAYKRAHTAERQS